MSTRQMKEFGEVSMTAQRRILIVDDDIDIATMLKLSLSQQGHEVYLHHSAKGALEAAKACSAELALLDIMLGDGIGFQVARSIRKDPMLYKTPILFQSVLDEQRDIEHALVEGGDGYLTKPYSLSNLTDQIRAMGHLSDEAENRCTVTGLHTTTRLRREIDCRLFREDPFALFLIGIDGLHEHHRGTDSRFVLDSATNMGNRLQKLVQNSGFYETVLCHMGSGTCMVLTKLDDKVRFRGCLDDLHADASAQTSSSKSPGQTAPKLVVAATDTKRKTYKHASQMIDDLKKANGNWQKQTERSISNANPTK